MLFDAVLLASFGGPESLEDVVPFLERVTAGRQIPKERLVEVGKHYFTLGGISPINAQNRTLLSAIRDELQSRKIDLPIYWGNRHSYPFFSDALSEIASDGHNKILAVATSAYSSYSSCRQYREDLAGSLISTKLDSQLEIAKIKPYFDQSGFTAPMQAKLFKVLSNSLLSGSDPKQIHILFTTHSIPEQMAITSGPNHSEETTHGIYVSQHQYVANKIMHELTLLSKVNFEWSLVYQSRSGAPSTPWLEPDINDAIVVLASKGITSVVVVPIGFISDHVEVIWDLDTQAKATAEGLGVSFNRIPTNGIQSTFITGLVDLIEEANDLRKLEHFENWSQLCSQNCCPNPRTANPVVVGI
jgi:ferrochelatase